MKIKTPKFQVDTVTKSFLIKNVKTNDKAIEIITWNYAKNRLKDTYPIPHLTLDIRILWERLLSVRNDSNNHAWEHVSVTEVKEFLSEHGKNLV